MVYIEVFVVYFGSKENVIERLTKIYTLLWLEKISFLLPKNSEFKLGGMGLHPQYVYI